MDQVTCERLLAEPRRECEVKRDDCEVFTRCVTVATPNGVVIACPTCANVRVV